MNRAGALLRLDQLSSSYLVILLLVMVVAVTGILFRIGLIKWAVAIAITLIRGAIRHGFELWERFLSWASLPTFASIVSVSLFVGWLMSKVFPFLTVVSAFIPMFMGVTACLAYMFIDQERYAVTRGYKAVHNPLKGQELAVNLVRYGPVVGVPLLVMASIGMVAGFAMLNLGLYETIGRSWYSIKEGEAAPTYIDFLANTLIVLLRIVDVLDFANSSHLLEVCYVRQSAWPAKTLLAVFRSFFTVVLLQQVFASFRQGLILSETIADLWNPNEPIHERACHALPQYGPVAVGPLLTSLGNVASLTKELREHLPQMLADIGPAATPELIRHLHDTHEHVRAVAAGALGHLRIRGTIVVLAPLSQDTSDIVRQSLTEALGIIASSNTGREETKVTILSPRSHLWRMLKLKSQIVEVPAIDPIELAVKVLQSAVTDRSLAVRAQAAKALGRIGTRAAEAADALIALLRDEDETVRYEAIVAVSKVGGHKSEIVNALVEILQDSCPQLRAAAAREIGSMGESAATAFPALAPLLQDRDESVREAAADAIGRIGHLDDGGADEIAEGLASPDSVVRAQTAEALGTIGECAQEAAPALVDALDDQNDMVRAKAVEALGKMGEAAADVAVPGLVRALQDDDHRVSSLAAEALGQMGDSADSAIPSLVSSLQHINADVRANAAESLGKLGAEAKTAIVALEQACLDEDGKVRCNAIRALGLIDDPTAPTTRMIREGLNDPDAQVRIAAIEALDRWGEMNASSREVLISLVDDPNEQVRALVTSVLPRLAGATQRVIEQLITRLREDTDLVQAQAAKALGELGPIAASAGEILLHAAQTGETNVRERAIEAIRAIRPSEVLVTQSDVDPELLEALIQLENPIEQNEVDDEIEEIPVIVTRVIDPETGQQVEAAIALEIAPDEELDEESKEPGAVPDQDS